MFAYIIFGFLLLILLLFLVKWAIEKPPHVVASLLVRLFWIVLALPLVYLNFRIFHPVIAFILSFLLIFSFAAMGRQRAGAGGFSYTRGGPAEQVSSVETAVLRMRLYHDTGKMEGEIVAGPFSGKSLDSLNMTELSQLWAFCQEHDPGSLSILENYLDREREEEWREDFGPGQEHGPRGEQTYGQGAEQQSQGDAGIKGEGMSDEEAYAILGLKEGCTKEEIQEAYRRLMQHLHPDHGGSNYLASKINQARKRLLGK